MGQNVLRSNNTDDPAAAQPNATEIYKIVNITRHPQYRFGRNYNDIALLQLDRLVKQSISIRPACLYQFNEIFDTVIVTGYGDTEFGGKQSNDLLKADLELVDNAECNKSYENQKTRALSVGIVDSQLCAGDMTGEKDTCQVSWYSSVVANLYFKSTNY